MKKQQSNMAEKTGYKKTPTVFQMEATECGAASLCMIFAFYGKSIPLEKMRIETGVSRDGCNAKNILIAARKYGMEAKGYSKSLNNLLKVKPPCIIHWNFNHFVVFEGRRGSYYYINDPASGRRKLTYEELSDAFTGIVLTFKPLDDFKKEKNKRSLLSFSKSYLTGNVPHIFLLLVIGFMLVIPGLLIPMFSQAFIDKILLSDNSHLAYRLLVMMFFTMVFQAFLTFYRGLTLQRLKVKMSMTSAHKFLSHLLRLPIGFFDQRYAGDLLTRVDNNNRVSDFLAGRLAQTLLDVFSALFYLILMVIYSPLLTIIGLSGIIINIIVVRLSSGYVENNTKKLLQDNSNLSGALSAGLSITDTIKASGAENEYISRIYGYYAKTITLEQKNGMLEQILKAIPDIFLSVSNILVLMAGGILIINGSMTAGMLVAYNFLQTSFAAPVNKLVGFSREIQKLKGDMGRVDDIMRYEQDPKFTDRDDLVSMSTKLTGEIEVNNISFGYSILEPPLIDELSFHLDCGSSIAFVGASGSGKSTVSKIISGLYMPWGGSIKFDGIPFEKIPKKIRDASISTVSQEIMLFSGSIRDNLTMWNKNILEEDMIRAAKDACIHDMITKKPGAYDFYLTEGGMNLSGGQRQRLEIARALVTNPTILILDEATSALDPIIEKQIVGNIKRRGCTCIIVAHRLSAVRDCDEIVVMENGKITQRGNHETLINIQGRYLSLVQNI